LNNNYLLFDLVIYLFIGYFDSQPLMTSCECDACLKSSMLPALQVSACLPSLFVVFEVRLGPSETH